MQRPGLVTFKAPSMEVRPDDDPRAMFARAWGCSAGTAKTPDDVRVIIERLRPTVIFVGPREPGGIVDVAWRELSGKNEVSGPKPEQLVVDVVVAEGEPALVGWHAHGRSRHITPSGLFDYAVPEAAPSRAYGKAVEGMLWSQADIRPGEVMLEIGAAPGGATLAYLERGLNVFAVDTQPMAAMILAHPNCLGWSQKSIGDVAWEDLPTHVQWISADAGISPVHMTRALRRLTLHYRSTLRGLLLTLKLNDAAAIAAMPGLLEELKRGDATVDAIQLQTNRSDLFVGVRYRSSNRKLR